MIMKEKVSLLNFRINNPHIDYPFNFPNIIKFGIHDDFHDLLESIKKIQILIFMVLIVYMKKIKKKKDLKYFISYYYSHLFTTIN